jgi:hypothetical protein
MKTLTFSKTAAGTYTIVDNNDEKLAIVAETLRNPHLRTQIQKLLSDLPTLIDRYHLLSKQTDNVKYYLLKETSDFVLIRVHDEQKPLDESNPLQIDMNCEVYLDLIEQWEDLEDMEPDQISLMREEDVFTLTDDPSDL